VLNRCGTHSVHHAISVACSVASEVAFLVVRFTATIIGAAGAIPEAVVPRRVLAAGVVLVAVVVERVVSSTDISSLLITLKPILERLDIRPCLWIHAVVTGAWNSNHACILAD